MQFYFWSPLLWFWDQLFQGAYKEDPCLDFAGLYKIKFLPERLKPPFTMSPN